MRIECSSLDDMDLELPEDVAINDGVTLVHDDTGAKMGRGILKPTIDGALSIYIPKKYPEMWGVKPKNDEQAYAFMQLDDDSIPLKIITGRAGTGKTYLVAAFILQMLADKRYKRVVLTRTTDEVGKSLGFLPGDLDTKFGAHLQSFEYAFKALSENGTDYWREKIEYIPIQFMRGISFPKGTIIWADEVAGLSMHEMAMLCSRAETGSSIILTGSLEQIDRERASKFSRGLYKLITDPRARDSQLVSHTNLTAVLRSPLTELITDVLGE